MTSAESVQPNDTMEKRAVRLVCFFPAPAYEFIDAEGDRLGVKNQEVVRRIVDEHRERVALREIRRLRKGEPMKITRGGPGNRPRKRDVDADRQLPLDCGA